MSEPLSILLVDDDALLRLTMRRRLEGLGWTVALASSGHSALDQLEVDRFDLVLSDVMMPEMDGLQLAAEAQLRGVTAPVVLMSGLASDGMQARASAVGVALLVAKPLGDDALRQIEAVGRGGRQGRELPLPSDIG